MSELTEHVGSRIRLYRKNRHMKLEELAGKISKSKATVSKYEKGDISIDIETLCKIASVLNVSIGQLTDLITTTQPTTTAPKNIFGNNELYLYYFDGRVSKLMRGFIQIHHDVQTNDKLVTLYLDVDSFTHYTKCGILYNGNVFFHDTVTNFLLSNQANSIERLNIIAINPIYNSDRIFALLSGISGKPFMPISVKGLLSVHMLPEDDELTDSLILSRDDIKVIKRYNLFTCDQIHN